MTENRNSAIRRDYASRTATFNAMIAHWEKLARNAFEAYRPEDGTTFEQNWPLFLNLLLLDQTIRWSKALRPLSEDCEN